MRRSMAVQWVEVHVSLRVRGPAGSIPVRESKRMQSTYASCLVFGNNGLYKKKNPPGTTSKWVWWR